MTLFYFLAAISIWLGLLSFRGGLRYRSYVRRELARSTSRFAPFVSLIAPMRGMDQGLEENLRALFRQNYPAYEVIFVTGRDDDPALSVLKELQAVPDQAIAWRVVIAGDATDSGQKVHNLRAAVAKMDVRSEAVVFVDTDARPHDNWLQSLIAPLSDEGLGASTGYRWFVPPGRGLAAHLRSVWNASIASALGEQRAKNFCWGGSTAVRRSTFEKLKVAERWVGTVSDDFTLTRVLHEAQLPIHFVPACLTAAFDDCSFRELIEFTTRQVKLTRVYAPHLWQAVLMGSLIFVLAFFGGGVLVVVRAALGLPVISPLVLLSIMFVLGAGKAWLRLQAVEMAMVTYGPRFRKATLAHLLLWPCASALFLGNAVAAAGSRRIRWRGIEYQLKSATEAVIISRQ